MKDEIQIITFYKFIDFTDLDLKKIKATILGLEESLELKGLVILASEGINTTLSVKKVNAEKLKESIKELLKIPDLFFKDSFSDRHPFHDLKVKFRPEIVTLNRPEFKAKDKHRHLSPKEWQAVIDSGDAVLLDTRNDYEYKIGHFKGAINPQISEFTEFPDYLKKSGIPKDKKVLIYCTGGIRCEKAIYEAEAQGYNNVYQLDGGIINYLKEFPFKSWDGECFVFDYRVAVDQELKPSEKWLLCPHCGDPGDKKIDCCQCGVKAVICEKCLNLKQDKLTCSKNCAHHYRMGHRSKRIHWDGLRNRGLGPLKELKA
jgi:UPF0176 protein